MTKNNDNLNIVPKKKVYNAAKEISSLNVSEAAVERVQEALNLLGVAIIKSAFAEAVYNQRKTILEKDVDCALDSFYNYLYVFDQIFSEDDEQNDDFVFSAGNKSPETIGIVIPITNIKTNVNITIFDFLMLSITTSFLFW